MNSRLLLVVGLFFVAVLLLTLGAGVLYTQTVKPEFEVSSVVIE
jgi:uncharacterized protein involved in exopolysaccharide biosynthesis